MEVKRITDVNSELIRELNKTFIKGAPDGKSGEWSLENAIKFVNNSDNIFLLAYMGEKIAGMISAYKLQRMDDKKAEIFFYEIGVSTQFRKMGVGRALIEELKRIARDLGIHEMFVLTDKSNIPARKLYESTGGKASESNEDIMYFYSP